MTAALNTSYSGVEVPWHESFARTPITVEAWARASGQNPLGAIAGFAPPALKQRWSLQVNAKGHLVAEFGGVSPWQVVSKMAVDPAQWHHWAMVVEEDQVRLFIDGMPAGEVAIRRYPETFNDGPLVIGTCLHPGSSLVSDALIEQVRLSRTARAFGGMPDRKLVNDEHTLALWDLSIGPADESGQGHDGELRSEKPGVSLDNLDVRSFCAGPSPLVRDSAPVELAQGAWPTVVGPTVLSLNGTWQMAGGGSEAQRLASAWDDAIPAEVPGSVHLALEKAGIIPDTKFGMNDAIGREMSFKTWWFRKTFARPEGTGQRLAFGGVAIHCTVWLNGEKLGEHEGMFGGPLFDVSDRLHDANEVIVKIEPAGHGRGWFWDSNDSWRKTVVFNCVYGWHYCDMPSLGIWRPVRIESAPAVRIEHPFIAIIDALKGKVKLCVNLRGEGTIQGQLRGTIAPENFDGEAHRFSVDLTGGTTESLLLDVVIPDPHPWWPNGIGSPDLYRLTLDFLPERGVPDTCTTTFGLRTIEMRPFPDGAHFKRYNWTFVINGRPLFVKGTGWCTMDAAMDFRRERYQRFLEIAQQQNCQMVRAWGGGMPETDDFYDLCDRMGIMVMQEWPTAWNSHEVQPYDILEETVRLNTLRLRNRASLVMWGAGNESGAPHGKAIDMMGRLSIELDGTRPFHRGEAWGGSDHNYDCWWGQAHLDHNLTMTARFWGEFGIACLPAYESVQRYLPDADKGLWPPTNFGSFAHHTPVFSRAGEMERLKQYSGSFTEGRTMRDFIRGSQLSQVVGVRHTLERARTRWPDCTGALMYKLNDNYPAASWSTVDWYGVAKIGHWFVQDAFAPLQACVLFDSTNNHGKPLALPVFLLDDADQLKNGRWQVNVRAYDGELKLIKGERFTGTGSIGRVGKLGEFTLSADQTDTTPLFVVTQVSIDGVCQAGTFYFVNQEAKKDSLFNLPRTTLTMGIKDNVVTITNSGQLPAVAVSLCDRPNLDTFSASDNYFWLEPGESREVVVSSAQELTTEAWNA